MRKSPLNARLIAVFISDLHLSLRAPVCRKEKDWLGVQAGYLKQIKELAVDVPILCSGDIFDRWDAPPELINFALDHLPDRMVSIPGQHDLPNHSMLHRGRSGYGVLAKVGKIIDVTEKPYFIPPKFDLFVVGYGWEEEIPSIEPNAGQFDKEDNVLTVALIHRYCWEGKHRYPGAPPTSNLSNLGDLVDQFDVVAFGDNHKGFISSLGDTTIINCGTFIRRKIDEIKYRPMAGLLYQDGSIKPHYLDCSKDEFHDHLSFDDGEQAVDVQSFIFELEKLEGTEIDFQTVVKRYLDDNGVHSEVKKKIFEILGL